MHCTCVHSLVPRPSGIIILIKQLLVLYVLLLIAKLELLFILVLFVRRHWKIIIYCGAVITV